MADIGDRVAAASKGGTRSGVVTGVSGAMITVRWDTGDETTLIPGPGVLSVVTPRATTTAKKTNVVSSQSGRTKKTEKAAPAKKSVAKASSSGRKTGKRRR